MQCNNVSNVYSVSTVTAVPLLLLLYGQTAICVPLPVTRRQYAGRTYSFAVTIVLNFVLFLLIAFGQLAIYSSIRSNTMTGAKRSQQSKDADIARRLFTIAMSDFLCWFPIGCLGLLASRGVAVPGEVSVALAVVVMPVNSAINPFLYTLNLLMERRRIRKEERLLKWLESQPGLA